MKFLAVEPSPLPILIRYYLLIDFIITLFEAVTGIQQAVNPKTKFQNAS